MREDQENKHGPQAAGTIDLTQEEYQAVYDPALTVADRKSWKVWSDGRFPLDPGKNRATMVKMAYQI